MEALLRTESCTAWAIRLDRPFEFESLFAGADFAVLLVIRDTTITAEEQASLSSDLVKQGCRYAVCTGHECSSWDDSIDAAYLETDADPKSADSTFVMTTWHEKESIDEVAEFFARHTSFDGFDPSRFLVVCLGGDDAAYGEVRDAASTQLHSAAVRLAEATGQPSSVDPSASRQPGVGSPSGITTLGEVCMAAAFGTAAMVLPVVADSNGVAHGGGVMREAVERVDLYPLGLLFLIGIAIGWFGRAPVWISAPATMLAFPLWSVFDMTVAGGDHNLLPFEWFFYALFALIPLIGAALARGVVGRHARAADRPSVD